MGSKPLNLSFAVLVAVAIGEPISVRALGAEAPTPAQALSLTPIQLLVEYTVPTKEEAAECTIRPEKENNMTSWVVRNRSGEILRRFADTNADNVVDIWCYYLDGLEVYRDIDSNFNSKADEYRWFHMAGTRWGIDKNEDGRIDTWQTISPHEVAEQVVFALKTRDQARLNLLLISPTELGELGFDKPRADGIAARLKGAPAAVSKLMSEQKLVTPASRYVDFGSARPGTIPSGTGGSTKDIVFCDNASALVKTDDKHEQVYLGTLVAVGDAWKLLDVPSALADSQQDGGLLLAPNMQAPGGGGGNAPTDEMQKLMAQLERLDKDSATLPAEKLAENIGQRADLLQKLSEVTPEADRDQWHRQLADLLGVAVQSGNYPQGAERLETLQKSLADSGADDDLIAHVEFQRMWSTYVVTQREPNANAAQLQAKWLTDLAAFVGQHPKATDSAEALLQLGMYQEFLEKVEEATKWYQQLVTTFPKAEQAPKANGALRRLGSIGKPIRLSGPDLAGGNVDLTAYRGKVVLIHFWATWCAPCKEDMVLLRDYYTKRGGSDFAIIGVCLDDDAASAKQYLAQNRFPWKHIHEKGGLDNRLANELGVMTPPLMILIDQKGNVANNNIRVAELEAEMAKLTKPADAAANALRGATPPR